MTIETLLGFRNIDSTEHFNSRLSGLIPKGIVKGGIVVAEPSSLQVRIKGAPTDDVVFMAFAKDGMMVRERAEERVLPVTAGITNVICLRVKYLESQDPIAQLEVLTLGAYTSDAEQESLIRFASVSPPAGATSVLTEHINLSFRDSIEGFRRGIVRGVVDTKIDLPATSGFPATAEVNFVSNDFVEGSSITINTGATSLTFPLITPISFPIASPAIPGFSRLNTSQRAIVDAVQDLTGQVVVTTTVDHDLLPGMTVRISDNSASSANRVWTIEATPTTNSFVFTASLTIPWTGYGGSVVDSITPALIIATIAPGYTHSLIPGQQFIIAGATDQTFNGLYTVQNVIDDQQFTFTQIGYPTRDSGNGKVSKVGFSLPPNAVEIGETGSITALNFQEVVRASELDGDLRIFALGSSLQIEARILGSTGNNYSISKQEPQATIPSIVISNFSGGIDPNSTASVSESLQKGDIYVVLFGDLGTIELWGYDGSIFRNMTSASASTLLDFHRRNLFVNEKHLSENEKAALLGTVGVPSATNRFVTEEDTSVLTENLAAALAGAESVPPGQSNRFLTEARVRGERGTINIPAGQDYVALPLGEAWVIGPDNTATDDSLTKQLFNVVQSETLLVSGGMTEYAQKDFTPVKVIGVYVNSAMTQVLNPSLYASYNGVYPRGDAVLSGLPLQLWVKLSGVPNNGTATLLYSKAVKEGNRVPQADMLMGPQRIMPAEVQDLINRSKEMRFNLGITSSGKTLSFPQNLFWAENLQGFSFRRFVALRPIEIRDAFSINFQTGTGTTGLVESFTPVQFSGSNLNKWTKYCLFVTPTNKIRVQHIADLLESPDTGLAFSSNRASLDGPTLPMTDGSWLFATVAVKSNGVAGSTILDLEDANLEFFSYQNSREPGAHTVIGDGVTTYGQFNGSSSHLHALLHAKSGDTIQLLSGTFTGHIIVEKDDITIDCSSGAILSNPGSTVITVNANRFRLIQPRFSDCALAINLQPGADSFHLEKPVFDTSVTRQLKAPPVISLTASSISTANLTFTYQDHGLLNGAKLNLKSSGVLPAGLLPDTDYFVVEKTQNTFKLSLERGGTPVSFLDGGSGVHSFSNGYIANAMIEGTAFAKWRVTDGTDKKLVGEFNSPDGIQQALDAANEGDTILVYPGVYNRFSINKDRLQLNGCGGSGVIIDAGGSLQTGILVSGNYNQIDNFFVRNAAIGISCQGKYNTFGTNIQFDQTVKTTVTFPETIASKHYNIYPSLTGRITTGENSVPSNAVVTVGDGVSSWGDYVGRNAINVALATESAGTLIQVFRGDYRQIEVDGTINGMAVVGTPGKETVIRADALRTTQCISINGSNNYFRNLYLIADNNEADAVGFSTVGIRVNGDDNYFENIEFPVTGGERIENHLKYQVISGARNRFIPHTGAPAGDISWTVGDGIRSFGDFNGSQGINAAIQALPTQPRALSGELFDSVGSTAKLRVAKTYQIESVSVASSTFTKTNHGFVLNEPVTLISTETLPIPLQGSPIGPLINRYYVINTTNNTFQLASIPATERASFSATSVVNSVITIPNHGIANGTQVSLTTTNDLPSGLLKSKTYYVVNATQDTLRFSETFGGSALTLLDGGTGTHRIYSGSPVTLTSAGSGTHTIISTLPFNFTFDDLYRNANISSASNDANFGSYRIKEVLGRSEVVLERLDGRNFVDETNLVADIVTGARITVFPGVYDPMIIPTSRNDIELSAWGGGSDTMIKGETDTATLLTINGSRCLIRGFRFAGGDPTVGLAIQVNGCHNTFIANRFETAKNYAFGTYALGNRVYDSHEDSSRTAITVGTNQSRSDFVGTTGSALQAAIDLAAQDSHIKTVVLGEGEWTLESSLSLPAGLVIQGSGEGSRLIGDGTFAAFQLNALGGQKVSNLKLSNFTFAAQGPCTDTLLSDLWLDSTVLSPDVNQGQIINSQTLRVGSNFAVFASGDVELKGISYTLPTAQAAGSNYILNNDGSGNLAWAESQAFLRNLNDVTITSASANEFLRYNGSRWVNESIYLTSTLDSLNDVTLTTSASGNFLSFNGSEWVNQAVLSPTNGGTGVLNEGTFTYGSNSLTFNTSGVTSLTLPTSGVVATTSNVLSNFAATTSSQLSSVIVDETGSGALVFANSPTLISPNLGTPSNVALDNATGLPLTTGVSGVLGIINGGTGQTDKIAAFNALSPTTTKGDIVASNGSSNVRQAVGSQGQVLTASSSSATGLTWTTVVDTLDSLTDVQIITSVSGQFLSFDGSQWINQSILSPRNGGTGVNNVGTLTYGSSNVTFSTTGNTTLTLPTTGVVATRSNRLSDFAATTSSQLSSIIVDETGSGSLVFANSPTLISPNLGTPSSVALDNAIGLPLTTGVSGVLGIINGGTGQTTASSALNALSPLQSKGDLLAFDGNFHVRQALGNDGQVLTASSSSSTGLTWTTVVDTLDSLTDVQITTSASGQFLSFDGSQWINQSILSPRNGGTGASNAASLTYGSNNVTFNTTGATSVTLPISGTLATTSIAPLTSKGDLLAHNGTSNVRFGVGQNGKVLTADSTEPAGFAWKDAPGTQPPGSIPIGGVIALFSNINGSYQPPSSGVVSGEGWMVCDGSVIPPGQVLSGRTPNLTDGRFILGSSGTGSATNPLIGFSGGGGSTGNNSVTLTVNNIPTLSTTYTPQGGLRNGGFSLEVPTATHTHTLTSRLSTGIPYIAPTAITSVNTGYPYVDVTRTPSATIFPTFLGTTTNISVGTPSPTSFSILPKYVAAIYMIRVV